MTPAKPATVHELNEGAKAAAEAAPLIELHIEHDSLASALVAALSDLMVVEKGRSVTVAHKGGGSHSYDYADIADVVKRTRPVLARHGVVALTPLGAHGDGLACTVTFLHTSGDRLDFGPFPFPQGHDAQATGSMVTYHRRYALVAALGMAAGDDDDGAAAKPRQPEPVQVEAHPLRAKAAELEDGGKVWAHFLSKAGITDADADEVLATNEGWRNWLSEGIAAHIAAGEPVATEDATDG